MMRPPSRFERRKSSDRTRFFLAAFAIFASGSPAVSHGDEAISYSRHVRPILAAKCFACHGPDAAAREADLRLDRFEDATADLGGYHALKPGRPDQSAIVERITSEDPDERMPPAKTNKTLSPAEIAILRGWIAAGGKYEDHWAFVAPARPAAPTVKNATWPRGAIDSFVLARLESAGLSPSPPADPVTLVRRLYLDLTGLPPSPEEADGWVARLGNSRLGNSGATAAIDEAAYRELVEQLLRSERYGERWARKWLDLARYADTNGFEKDRQRNIWPYRDWVIRALNADMPFDQFTIEQIAGDLLPHPTQDQLIATGFHRNTMLNEEGGIDPLEYRFYALADRVATTGTTWLGLTLGCVQCHTHKFDPIVHTEYYRLMALMNNADEPELDLIDPAAAAAQPERLAQADRLMAELANQWPVEAGDEATREERRKGARGKAFADWIARERSRTAPWTDLRPTTATSNLPLLTVREDNSIFASGDISKDDTYELTFADVPAGVTAIRLEVLPDDRLPAHGPGMTYYEGPKGDFFLGEFQIFAGDSKLAIDRASESYAKNTFGAPVSAKLATDGDPQTGWSCSGRFGEAHQAVFVLAQPLAQTGPLKITLRFGRHYACSLGRFRLSATSDPDGAEARGLDREADDLLALADSDLTAPRRAKLLEHFLLASPELANEAKRIRELRATPAYASTLVLQERPASNPRPTRRHHRGEYLQPKELVEPGVPEFLPDLPAGEPRNRLAFARWLVSKENPLTARVVVNRQWAALFGQGIVRTPGDFGFQSELPTHPELLDWLAREFMDNGWSLKILHRQIVLSATYRQSSRVTPEHLASDPQNRLLSRGPRVRIDAELVRDVALSAAGLLSPKMYGQPVRPPQPAGVLEAAYGGNSWNVSQGEDRYRRGIYTFIKRTAPYATFNTFDGPSGEVCVASRDVSNTPLQALTLLNDEAFVEASRALGALAADRQGDDRAKATFVFRRCLTRTPEAKELDSLIAFVASQRQRLTDGELKGDELAPGGGNSLERAIWTTLARAVVNLDETITRN